MKLSGMSLLRFVLASLLMAGFTHAQSTSFRVDVPFQFSVDDATLPAGSYSIQKGPLFYGRTLTIRDLSPFWSFLVARPTASRSGASLPTFSLCCSSAQ